MAVAALNKHSNETLALRDGAAVDSRATQKHLSSHASSEASSLDDFLASVEQKGFRIAYYSVKDEQLALDLVQDAMLKLVEKYASKRPAEWPALFFTILSNRIIDARRWNKLREGGGKLISLFRPRSSDHEGQYDDALDTAEIYDLRQATEPESGAFGNELRDIIDRALTALSERQRQVFLLREWQGFNVQQTAAILGCSEGSVKQHHFRAMRSLRNKLVRVWGNEQDRLGKRSPPA